MKDQVSFRFVAKSTSGKPERLDKVVLQAASEISELQGFSRSHLKRWINDGLVRIDGVPRLKPGSLVQPDSVVEIAAPSSVPSEIVSSGRELDILFQDRELLVINKPAGLSMHPGAGRASDTLVHAVIGYIDEDERRSGVRPGIVHRLDMDTTGIVVVAKTVQAHFALSRQFAGRTTGREYLALVFSTPRSRREISRSDSGVVATQIGRHPRQRQEMAVLDSGGKKAVTHWRVVERMGYGTLVALKLETGRTHQIRVHMMHIGSPVIGDQVYGDFSGLPAILKAAAIRFGRQALHARVLEFDHPVTGERMRFEQDPPVDFSSLVEAFRVSK